MHSSVPSKEDLEDLALVLSACRFYQKHLQAQDTRELTSLTRPVGRNRVKRRQNIANLHRLIRVLSTAKSLRAALIEQRHNDGPAQ